MMRWLLTASLATLLLATAFGVIYTRHESRKSFVELQALEAARDEANVDWGRLQLEHATWAEAGRVEQVARGDLGLVHKAPERVVVIVEEADKPERRK